MLFCITLLQFNVKKYINQKHAEKQRNDDDCIENG